MQHLGKYSGLPGDLSSASAALSTYTMAQYTLGAAGDFASEGPYAVNIVRADGRQFANVDAGGYEELPAGRSQQLQSQLLQQHQQHQQQQTGYLPDTHDHGSRDPDDDDYRDDDGSQDGDGQDDDGSRGSRRPRVKKPHLQGRFSGRLATKEDERRLAEECKLLGPLLGGVGKRGDKSRLTLAKIVRGIATGDIRRYCEERERLIQTLKNRLAAVDPNGNTTQLDNLRQENNMLRVELSNKDEVLQELADKGIIAGFVPSMLTAQQPGQLGPLPQDGRFAPYAINLRRDRPVLPQYLPLASARGGAAMLSADFLRREHSAPVVAAAALSDGPTMSGTSRANVRPPPPVQVQRKVSVMAAGSEPMSIQPPMSAQSSLGPLSHATHTVAIHQMDIQQQLANLQAQVEQLQNLQAPTGTITVPLNNAGLVAGSLGQGLQFQPAGNGRFAVQFATTAGGNGDVELKADGVQQVQQVQVQQQDGGQVQQQTLRAMPALDFRITPTTAAAAAAAVAACGGLAGGMRFSDGSALGNVNDNNGGGWS